MKTKNPEAYDKAVELMEAMENVCFQDNHYTLEAAKIAVNEIINVLTHPFDGRKDPSCFFWEQVLEELKGLGI